MIRYHGIFSVVIAIRINDQFRVCFTWRDGHAYDVEITDYH
jgi:toxin HigB-1